MLQRRRQLLELLQRSVEANALVEAIARIGVDDQLAVRLKLVALFPLERVLPPRLALGRRDQPRLPIAVAIGCSRRNCIHANEHASSAISNDERTVPRIVRKSSTWNSM